ncbi:MAG: hypothetical protein AAF549_07590 [Pseudomonadota bacterium]
MMRLFFTFLTLIFFTSFTGSADAATSITKTGAKAYYENCKSRPDPNMSANTQDHLCACTAAQMMKNMKVEEVQAMSLQNEQGRAATNKMIVEVYAPCMNHPAKELYLKNCLENPQTSSIAKDVNATCECMSDRVAQYLKEDGPKVFEGILSRNPNIADPMAALSEDPAFTAFAQKQVVSCIQ